MKTQIEFQFQLRAGIRILNKHLAILLRHIRCRTNIDAKEVSWWLNKKKNRTQIKHSVEI